MHSVEIHRVIRKIIHYFYRAGFWHRGDALTARDWGIKLFYCVFHSLFVLSFVLGGLSYKNPDQTVFLLEASVIIGVLSIKLNYLMWNRNRIVELLNRICIFPVRREDDFNRVNGQLDGFSKFIMMLGISTVVAGMTEAAVIPFIGSKRTSFFKIAFPLDYENEEYAFWLVHSFSFVGMIVSDVGIVFSSVVWYLMLNCSLRYEVLANDLRMLGKEDGNEQRKIWDKENHNRFYQDLKALIETHLHTRELINDLEGFVSHLFFIQIGTSAVCISGSIYCMAMLEFNAMDFLIHIYSMILNISEIFMITYLGNEILLSSDSLSHSLYESGWPDHPQPTKKCVIIFCEYLKQPHEMVVGKMYALSLVTFTSILNSAYSLFNLLVTMSE